MKRIRTISGLIAVISLLLSVIWLSPAFAAVPVLSSLGEFMVEGMAVPGAMDADNLGNLYIADTRGGKVFKVDQYGNLLQSFALQGNGSGVAVTPDGQRLYVSRKNDVVVADANTGVVLSVLDGSENEVAEFHLAGPIDLDAAGNVYIADIARSEIKVFNSAGVFQTRFGGVGTTNGLFKSIGGMAVSPTGKVVVADASALNAKVHVFTLDAGLNVTSVAAYANTAFGSPVMHLPKGISFDTTGRGYVLERFNSHIRMISSGFAYLGAYNNPAGILAGVTDTAFDSVNNRLFVGMTSGRVSVFGVDGGQNPVPQINRAPGMPSTISPVGGSEVPSASPVLMIGNATDEDGDDLTYHVTVKQAEAVVYEADVAGQPGDTTSISVPVALDENMGFSWTVQASDGELSSDVSPAANFVVNAVEEAPSVPVLMTPDNGESVDGAAGLSWGSCSDPDPNDNVMSYVVEVALDDSFTEIVASENTSDTMMALNAMAAYGDLVDGTPYFWHVFAADQSQMMSEPSATGQFVYDTTVLSVTANIPGAQVFLNGNHGYAGQKIGVVPLEIYDVMTGTVSVVVERPGFETFVDHVVITDKANISIDAELVPAKVVASLSENKNAINGRKGISVNSVAKPFIVDFDNDGDLDLLAGGDGEVTLFANLVMSSLFRFDVDNGIALDLPVVNGAAPFVVDWNNDGRKDLLVGQSEGQVTLFTNIGLNEAPVFDAGVNLDAAGSVLTVGSNAAPAVIDDGNDGDKDLLVGNAAGDVLLFVNQGSDENPQLVAPVVVVNVGSPVVPMTVDWDADGQQELLLSYADKIGVFAKIDGQYQPVQEFAEKKVNYIGAFPIAIDEYGKQLFVGKANGEIVILTGNNVEPVAAFYQALQDKVDELGALVAAENPALLDQVTTIDSLITTGDFIGAAAATDALAAQLPAGAAQDSALELAALLKIRYLS